MPLEMLHWPTLQVPLVVLQTGLVKLQPLYAIQVGKSQRLFTFGEHATGAQTQPLVVSQVPVWHGSLEVQTEFCAACRQPLTGSQLSIVQARPSSQFLGVVPQAPVLALQTAATHAVLGQEIAVNTQLPLVESHESVVHKLLSLQTLAEYWQPNTGSQVGCWQRSVTGHCVVFVTHRFVAEEQYETAHLFEAAHGAHPVWAQPAMLTFCQPFGSIQERYWQAAAEPGAGSATAAAVQPLPGTQV